MNAIIKTFVLAAALLMPAAANAQSSTTTPADMPAWYVSPFLGSATAGGDAARSGAPAMGVAVGWSGRAWGAEFDIADAPAFFQQDDYRIDRRVATVTGTFLARMPLGHSLTAYGAGGFGLMQVRLAEAGNLARVETDQPAFNAGGGLMWMKSRVGVRGDVRYFRAMGDDADDANPFALDVSSLDFVRVAVGLMVGF